jgi:hypothetical protein
MMQMNTPSSVKDIIGPIIFTIVATGIGLALIPAINWVSEREISKRWWRGFYVMSQILLFTFISLVAAGAIAAIFCIAVELFHPLKDDRLLFKIATSILLFLIAPLLFPEKFDAAGSEN